MGSSYDFNCSACGYETHVSGGRDAGMVVVVETCTCRSCHSVVDVVRAWIEQESTEPVDECPKCRSTEVDVWDAETRPCPKCGGRMQYGQMVTLWD